MMLFVVFITAQPFFLRHEIIMMETGIHLPAINALFHGAVPYRDFFFLRGPMELYVPALMMKFFGVNSALLPVFYYAGTMLTLLLCVALAGALFNSRLVFYAMVPAFVARTFPRISYYYWGGMRYAMGFLVLLFLFYFFKTRQRRYIFFTGMACALSALTTPEAGLSTIFGVGAGMAFAWALKVYDRPFLQRSFVHGLAGFAAVLVPYFIYLAATGSLNAFLEMNYAVCMFNGRAYPGAPGIKPESLMEFLLALIPGNKFFKYMGPAWCYIFFAGFLWYRARQKKLDWTHAFLVGLSGYGLVLYAAAFRKIEGHHFEMALQAEKFVYFFMIECALLYWWAQGRRALVYVAAGALLLSSVVYAVDRFDHRFVMFKLIEKDVFHKKKVKGLALLEDQETAKLNTERASGHIVPRWQDEEVRGVTDFLKTRTRADEPVFCYPEVGNFNFWADRPFVGRFPIYTFTWMYGPWHEELWVDLQKAKPRYVVMTHAGHRTFPAAWYFRNPQNKEYFDRFTRYILENYTPVKSFESVGIYERKPNS